MLDAATQPATIRALLAGEGETLDVFGGPMIVKLDGSDGLFLAENEAPPGYCVPLHVHDADEEVFRILDGTLTLLTGEGEREAGPGTCVRLPCDIPHGFRNGTGRPVRFLVMVNEGRKTAGLFRGLDGLTRAGELSPAAIGARCAEHGVRML